MKNPSKVSIIIPVYNEEETILEILKRIDAVELSLEKEVIIVDDHSSDQTQEILRQLDERKYKVILKNKNEGKGAAIKTGLKATQGDIVIFQDADLEYDPSDYSAMIKPILDGRTEAVLGVRTKPGGNKIRYKSAYYWSSWLGNIIITTMTNVLFWNDAAEYEGCYKAFTKRLLDTIEVSANGFEYDNELVCKILKKGYKTTDVSISYRPRTYEEGKHIKWKDGFIILWTIIKYRFSD